ncbi:hypothetical protein HDV62DRAFT_257818 [Trichoderma sp. SZMC 28011]
MEAITIVVLLLSLLLQPLASACCNTSPGALASRITLRHQRNIKCNIRHQLLACSLTFAQIPFLPSTLSHNSSPLLEAAHKLRLKPKIPLQARLSLVSRPPFAGSLSQSFSTVAVVSCRCTVQLRGTGTGSTGCE